MSMNIFGSRYGSSGRGMVAIILILMALIAMLYYMGIIPGRETQQEAGPGAQKLKNTFIKDHDEMQKQIDDLK